MSASPYRTVLDVMPAGRGIHWQWSSPWRVLGSGYVRTFEHHEWGTVHVLFNDHHVTML